MKKHISAVLFLLFAIPTGIASAQVFRHAPQFLTEEIFRLTGQCYYFYEYVMFPQGGESYVVATFLSKDAIRVRGRQSESPGATEPCGAPPPQLRLYRFISDSTVAFCDSVIIPVFSMTLGVAADFDNAGTRKVMVNHSCKIVQGRMAPLLCYAFSIFEVTHEGRLRNVITPPYVPERRVNVEPTGRALEPVVSDNFDKTPYPELLAVDDFFEGDPAFREDDFPKVTLIYTWDDTARIFRHRSNLFPARFALAVRDSLSLTQTMERIMALAAVGRWEDAEQMIGTHLTPERCAAWRAQTPARASHIGHDRLRDKLRVCIDRYKTP